MVTIETGIRGIIVESENNTSRFDRLPNCLEVVQLYGKNHIKFVEWVRY